MSELVTSPPQEAPTLTREQIFHELSALEEFESPIRDDSDLEDRLVAANERITVSQVIHFYHLGMVAAAATTVYGERTVQRIASKMRLGTSTLYTRAEFARAWYGRPLNPMMTYTAHLDAGRLSKLTGEPPEKVLARVQDEGLSPRAIREEIATLKGRTLEPHAPEPYPLPTPEHSRKLEFFKEHVRAQPCVICGVKGRTEVSHFRGLVNPKTGEMGTRRHGLSDWLILPICDVHHRTGPESLHSVGESQFLEKHFGGLDIVMGVWATILLSWLERWE